MTETIVITPIKRHKSSKVGRAVMWCIAYGIMVPINWLMGLCGARHKVLRSMINTRKGAESAFKDYVPNEQDIFVCTYPKSGTNWMMQMAHQIIFHGEGEFENIHDVVPWPDAGPKRSARFTIPLTSTVVQQVSPEHKRVIKTHLPLRYVPYNNEAKYIVVVRDPKEVFVSSYHFLFSSFRPLMPTATEWFELFFTQDFPMNFGGSSWIEHAAAWWALCENSNVLVLSYASMKKDLRGTIENVAAFLGVKLTPAAFARVYEKCTFAYMKAIDEKFVPMPKGTVPWGEMEMMRAGKAGNSGELISLEQQQRIDAHCQAELARLGSTLPYTEFCKPGTSALA